MLRGQRFVAKAIVRASYADNKLELQYVEDDLLSGR